MGILLLIVFAFTICSIGAIVIFISASNKKKRCILQIPGVVVSVRQEDMGMQEYSGTTVYRPVVNYEYDGQTYTYYHNVAKTSYRDIPVGMQVTININPNNPSEAVLKI